jgi:hypothetical protein
MGDESYVETLPGRGPTDGPGHHQRRLRLPPDDDDAGAVLPAGLPGAVPLPAGWRGGVRLPAGDRPADVVRERVTPPRAGSPGPRPPPSPSCRFVTSALSRASVTACPVARPNPSFFISARLRPIGRQAYFRCRHEAGAGLTPAGDRPVRKECGVMENARRPDRRYPPMRLRLLGMVVLFTSMLLSTGCCCHRGCWRHCSPCCCAPVTCCHPGEPGLAPPLAPPLPPGH